MPSIPSAANTAAKLDLIDFTGSTLLLPNNVSMTANVTFGSNGVTFSDGSQQTVAGASPGFALAAAIILG